MMLPDWARGIKPLLARGVRRGNEAVVSLPDQAERARIEHNVFVMRQTYREKLCEIAQSQAEIAECKRRAAGLPPGDVTIDALISEISMRTCELEQLRTDALDVQEVLRQNRAYLGLIRHEELCQRLKQHTPGSVEEISVRVRRIAELSQCQRDDAADMHIILSQAARFVLRQESAGLSALDEQIRGEIALIRDRNGFVHELSGSAENANVADAELSGAWTVAREADVEPSDRLNEYDCGAPVFVESDRIKVCDCLPHYVATPGDVDIEITECSSMSDVAVRESNDNKHVYASNSDMDAPRAGGMI